MNLNKDVGSRPCRVTAEVECHFRDLKQVLLNELSQYEIAIGCVAWISDHDILQGLTEKDSVIILDSKIHKMGKKLESLYGQLRGNKQAVYDLLLNGLNSENYLHNTHPDKTIHLGSFADTWNFEGGLYAVDGFYRFMHHKFLIMARDTGFICPRCYRGIYQTVVWTGSFNFTKNANNGLENAVIIRDPYISASYLYEFMEIYKGHARQLNITNLEEMRKGMQKDPNPDLLSPLCERGEEFPLEWFAPCTKDFCFKYPQDPKKAV